MDFVQRKKNIAEYDVLRVVLTILVLLGHCLYYSMQTNYGGIDYTIYFSDDLLSIKLFTYLYTLIYLFHMPCYMALSGALFHYTWAKRKSNSTLTLISSKCKRLILPYIFVTLLYSIPIKGFSGYWINSKNIIKDIVIGQIFLQGNSHLWFLPTLFFVTIIAHLLLHKFKIGFFFYMLIAVILFVMGQFIDINIIKYIFRNLLWFGMGYLFDIRRISINNKISNNKLLYSTSVFITLFLLIVTNKNNILHVNFILKIIAAIMGCYMSYCLSYILVNKKIIFNKIYKIFLDNSFGLYLYSDALNYLILFMAVVLCGSRMFASETGNILIFFCRILITTFVALAVSQMLRCIKQKLVSGVMINREINEKI